MTISSERDQARDDYLRTERRKAYAAFQGCLDEVRNAFFDVFEDGDGYITAHTRFAEHIVSAVHNAADCVDEAYLQVELLAPANIAQTSWTIQNYYGLRVQAFDGVLKALSDAPEDPVKLDRARSLLDIQDVPRHVGSVEREPVIDVEVRLVAEMRQNLGNSSDP